MGRLGDLTAGKVLKGFIIRRLIGKKMWFVVKSRKKCGDCGPG